MKIILYFSNNMSELNKCRFVMVKQMYKTHPNKHKEFLHYFYHAYITAVKDIFVAFKDKFGIVNEHKIVGEFPKVSILYVQWKNYVVL